MNMMTEHAKKELELAGLLDEDSDYNGMLGKSVLELMEVFTKQGHSGASASLTIEVFTKLAKYENLTPITSNPDEWMDISEMSESPMWQSKRNPYLFSTDGGKTWYNVDDKQIKTDKSDQNSK